MDDFFRSRLNNRMDNIADRGNRTEDNDKANMMMVFPRDHTSPSLNE